MHKPLLLLALALAALASGPAAGDAPPPAKEEKVREIFVPFDDLNVLLEGATERVLLSRQQYEELLAKAKKTAESRAPREAIPASADYTATAGDERAEISGALTLSVLEDGLHAVPLDLAGVGLRGATLDGKGAPIGLADDGRLMAFVEGKGQHKLVLDMVAPLATTAARQILNLRLPVPAAATLRLTVPGDVEVKSGAPVVARTFDEAAGQTRIELLPQRGDVSIVMTLNSRLKRKDRVVVARSVLVDEVTAGYERLHATVSMAVLHRAVDQFRFAVPAGFEVTDVRSPMLARWAMATEGNRRIIEVQLREETTETTVLALSIARASPNLAAWAMPTLEPLDVAGHLAVVCLAVEDRLKAEAVASSGLIPIDTSVLTQALPATVLDAQPGAARIRPVVAYYAPQGQFSLTARFVKPPASLRVTTNLLAILEDGGMTIRGGFALVPEEEKLFDLDFSVPAGWDVLSVTGEGGEALSFERYGAAGQAGRVHVRLGAGAPAGAERRVFFRAVHVPKGWLGEWATTAADFPVFAVAGAARDEGALAVDARDDMTVRPETLDRLVPLDENEKTKYGLAGVSAALAYRYDGQPWKTRLTVERTLPRITAQTFSFFRVERDALVAHYELVYDVAQARTRRLAILLPKETPTALSIRGLGGVALKEFLSEPAGEKDKERRRWAALLADRRSGTVRLAVDFEQRLESQEPKDLVLPIVEADGVAYQTGLVAVEGSPELDVQVATKERRVDIGELVDAEYQPGRRLLGAFGFLGEPAPVKVSVARHPVCGLPPAIVQQVELATVMSADRLAQTAARFRLRTKALFLGIKLPSDSSLWSATLDSRPTKPQREADSLLVSLPAGAEGVVHDLQVVYETPVRGLGFWSNLRAAAPRLFLHAWRESEGEEVPVADLLWYLYMPTGYRVLRAEGSVMTDDVSPPSLAAARMAGAIWHSSGGVDLSHSAIALMLGLGSTAMRGCGDLAHPWRAATESAPGMPAAGKQLSAEQAPSDEMAELESKRPGEHRLHGAAKNGKAMEGDLSGLMDLEKAAGERAPKKPAPGPVAGPKPDASRADALAGGAERPPRTGTGMTGLGAAAPATTPAPPAAPPPAEQPPAVQEAPKLEPPRNYAAKEKKGGWALEGVSSLVIDLERIGKPVTFRSLGSEPCLALTVADETRTGALAWALALAVIVAGLVLTTQPVARKTAYVVGVALVATLIPVITGRIELALIVNGAFFAACLLVPYYLVAGAARWTARKVRALVSPQTVASGTMLLVLGGAVALGASPGSAAEAPPAPYVIQVVPPPAPVKVPEDALILPYDPAAKVGVPAVDKLLVPYARYVELWNQAYPERPIGEKKPPAPYALAGASFTAVLKGDEFLLAEGTIDIDVYSEDYVIVPLPLDGGVLAKADLDGKPARLSVAQVGGPAPVPAHLRAEAAGKAPAQAEAPPPKSFLVLYASGKGRHRLDVAVRMRLEKRGGWRAAEGRLPAAPATALALRAPDAGTEIRLGAISDRRTYETKSADQVISTALGPGGAIAIQWRPKVSEGQTDTSLTAQSTATLDVQEDSLRLVWGLELEFRHGEREFFTVEVPVGYLVEKVEGTNVRGWELKASGGRQELEVSLLKRAKATEGFAVTIWRSAAGQAEFDAPLIGVTGAVRHSGRLVIRRSPLLDLKTVSTSGVTRADLPPDHPPLPRAAGPAPAKGAADESPLGIRPYQAYQFVATPFSVRLAAAPIAAKVAAEVQTILKVSERERRIESRTVLTIENRPIHEVRFTVPAELRLDRVLAPGAFEWALTDVNEDGRKLLTVYLAGGVQGTCAIVIQGKLGPDRQTLETPVPRLAVLNVDRQQGDIVVQVDPAFDVQTDGLVNLERILKDRTYGWLQEGQRALAALALHYVRPDYAGRLILSPRKADVTCFTVTNSRVTDRAIQDAVLLDFTIKNAGIREVSFTLPAWMKDAKVSVPLLRQKTVTPVPDDPSRVRVQVQLQDEVMDQLRVLVENDRLLSGRTFDVPIPVVETGRTDRRYVAVESAGRDEVVVETKDGLDPLSRQQKEWATVAGLLRGGMTQAFIVAAGAEKPRLAARTKEREAVETVKARIGLARTLLVMDTSGAYRAAQQYRIDNRTEQFLEIQMPEGAALWTATVAGEPVKPTLVNDPARPRHVRIPIVKTAAGDLDYSVVLKYGGKLAALEALRASIRFPIVRSVNINAELSQVELYLPETQAWFYFRTKMTPVTEEGDFVAGELAYQTKQADRLMQTLRADNPFAQARAKLNLKSVVQSMQTFQETAGQYEANKAIRGELGNANIVLKNAEKEMQVQVQPGEIALDNNDRIREAFSGQRNTLARNVVKGLGFNWAEAPAQPPPGAAPQGQVTFNDAWLATNRLENKPADAAAKARQGARFMDIEQGAAYARQAAQAGQQAAKVPGKQMFQKFTEEDRKAQSKEQAQPIAESQLRQRRGTVDETVERYQQKLDQQQQQVQQAVTTPTVERPEIIGVGSGGRQGGAGRGITGRGRGPVGPAALEAPAFAGVPAGMASLDVELPTRGKVYRFSTPRGDTEVTASAASQPLIDGLERVGGAAALVLAVLFVRRMLRRRTLDLPAQNTLATVLIVLGLVGMLIGILPVAGLVAMVVGVAIKVRLFRARRRPAAA
jgi:hypothetical protein